MKSRHKAESLKPETNDFEDEKLQIESQKLKAKALVVKPRAWQIRVCCQVRSLDTSNAEVCGFKFRRGCYFFSLHYKIHIFWGNNSKFLFRNSKSHRILKGKPASLAQILQPNFFLVIFCKVDIRRRKHALKIAHLRIVYSTYLYNIQRE